MSHLKCLFLVAVFLNISLSYAIEFDSSYSSIKRIDCNEISWEKETAISIINCPSFNGIKVYIDSDDTMQGITLIRKGEKYPLKLWTVVTPSIAPNPSYLGDLIEWRHHKGKPNKITGIIIRTTVVKETNKSKVVKKVSHLVVSKINKNKICVVGKIPPQAHQNQLARKMVDQSSEMPCIKDASLPQ